MTIPHAQRARRLVHAALLAGAGTAMAAEAPPDSLAAAITGGKVAFQFRYRFENVDQDNALEEADASTLKSRIGYTTGVFRGWQAQIEADDVSPIGDEDYNSTSNNETGYSVVADPEGTEINQVWLSWAGLPATTLKGGRQRVILDNERFVGGVGWRQNEQTYDGVSVVNRSIPHSTLSYAWVTNVNRVFGPDDGTTATWLGDWETQLHLLNASYAGLPFGTITVYDYLMDIEDAHAQSNQTWGVRFSGKHPFNACLAAVYTAEYARQEDYADNPDSYEADYYTVDLGLAGGTLWTANAGIEVLEGDRRRAGRTFDTPLATLHKFQGWADLFLATPQAGITDRYAGGAVTLMGATLTMVYHDFEAEDGGASLGTEWDASLARKFGTHVSALLKYADYDADGFSADTRKLWLQLQIDF